MKRISALAILALFAGLLAYGQQSQPSQPPDPTAQSPATQAPPTTPPTFPRTESKPDSEQAPAAHPSQESRETSAKTAKVFTGTITQDKNGYVLQTGDQKYKLDDQPKAKEYDGKHVKVQGSLDRNNNVIRVDKIEEAPSM